MADLKITPGPNQALYNMVVENFEALHSPADRVWMMDYDKCLSYIIFWIAQSHTVNGVNFDKAYAIAGMLLARHQKHPKVRKEDPESLADAVAGLSPEDRSRFLEALIDPDR